jgi:hypothetical protein
VVLNAAAQTLVVKLAEKGVPADADLLRKRRWVLARDVAGVEGTDDLGVVAKPGPTGVRHP